MKKYKIVWYNDKDTAIGSRFLRESEIGPEVDGMGRFEIDQSGFPEDADYICIEGVDGTSDPVLADFSKPLDYL